MPALLPSTRARLPQSAQAGHAHDFAGALGRRRRTTTGVAADLRRRRRRRRRRRGRHRYYDWCSSPCRWPVTNIKVSIWLLIRRNRTVATAPRGELAYYRSGVTNQFRFTTQVAVAGRKRGAVVVTAAFTPGHPTRSSTRMPPPPRRESAACRRGQRRERQACSTVSRLAEDWIV